MTIHRLSEQTTFNTLVTKKKKVMLKTFIVENKTSQTWVKPMGQTGNHKKYLSVTQSSHFY
jgi:hypothetical protein